MVFSWKRYDCSFWVGCEVLPQVKEFKYFRMLFISERKMVCEIERQIGAASGIFQTLLWFYGVKKKAELQGETLCLLNGLHSCPHLWSQISTG